MSYAPSVLADCPDIQLELNNYFVNCNSASLEEATPVFDFLMSSINRSGYSQQVAPGQGKLRNIVLRYSQRILESEVTQPGTCERSCDATTKRGDLTTTCSIDPCQYWEVQEHINVQDFREACRNNFDIVNEKLMAMMSVLRRKIATAMTEELIALIGPWNAMVEGTNGNYLEVQTLKTGSEDISPNAFEEIQAAIMQTQYCNGSVIFSGRDLWKYYRLMLAGCCSNQGLALGEILAQYGQAVMYDARLQKAFADASKAIVVQPGSVQVVTYNENDNGIAGAAGITTGANYQSMLIFDPKTGLPIDLTLKDECPGDISIFMRANTKLCGLPDDLYAPGDDMEGVVYVNGIDVVNA